MAQYPVKGDKSIMCQKAHGTTEKEPMKDLRWGCDHEEADSICSFGKCENLGYFMKKTSFLDSEEAKNGDTTPIEFCDSVTGEVLFTAPKGRTMQQFIDESKDHGWPSFRDEEVNWENVRCLDDGEAVSLTGTHLGHNLPDGKGNRYCINMVSVAGQKKQG